MLVTIKSNDSTNGSINTTLPPNVTITASVANGYTYEVPLNASFVLDAQPAAGCQFVCWNDGETNPVRQISVTSNDVTYMAIFAKTVNAFPRPRFFRNRRGVARSLLASLLHYPIRLASPHNPCPDATPYNGQSPNVGQDAEKIKGYQCVSQSNCGSKAARCLLPLLIILIAGVFVLLALSGCTSQQVFNSQTTDKSTSVHAEITPSFNNTDSRNTSVKVEINPRVINRTVYDTVVIHDSTFVLAHPCNTTIYTIHHYDADWIELIYLFLIAILFAVVILLVVKCVMPLYHKRAEFENKMQEKRYNDYVRFLDEDRAYERRITETSVSLWEKREKMIVDEWVRDNEHDRKLDIMERERITSMNNMLVELAKIKNVIRYMDRTGNTVTTEQTIMS